MVAVVVVAVLRIEGMFNGGNVLGKQLIFLETKSLSHVLTIHSANYKSFPCCND